MFPPYKKADESPPPEPPHYFTVDLTPVMRGRLLNVMKGQASDGITSSIVEALELAERIDLPFTPPVDWDALERKARDQGYDVVDQIYDAKRKEAP